jgi:DNA-binding transcriptional regulator LsrR (DeoR family)
MRAIAPPLEFGGSAMIWATWLYYAEQRTQAEVAQALGVSRASVANYLAEARHRGLVRVEINADLLTGLSESRRLAERFGLQGALVAPVAGDEAGDAQRLRERLGRAAAVALDRVLSDGMVIGVAWGRTMSALARALPERQLSDVTVAQVSGSFFDESDSAPEACTALIASRLGARCRNFHAPAVLSSRATRDALCAEPALRRHGDLLRRCDLVLLGVGELHGAVACAEIDLLADDVIEGYLAAGACGVVLGRFLDASGCEVAGALSGRQIGMELAELAAAPLRIAVAGGAEKLPAIRALLAGRLATHLVTDRLTAAALLDG